MTAAEMAAQLTEEGKVVDKATRKALERNQRHAPRHPISQHGADNLGRRGPHLAAETQAATAPRTKVITS